MPTTTTTTEPEIAYDRYGDADGRPLVLLHGGMAPRAYWDPVVPHFEAEYDVVIPERPGFGTCRDDPAETSAEAVLAREKRYVRALRAELDRDPILFGHSYGALTAMEAAVDVPTAAVVAYEPAVLPEDFRAEADLADRMEALVADGNRREAAKLYVERVLHPEGVDDLDAWLAAWPVWPDCVDLVEEVVRMNRAVERYRLPEHLDVDAPVLVLTGTDGPGFLRRSARDVHGALPRSRLVEFDGVSHSGPGEAPETVVASIRAFLGTNGVTGR